MLRNTLLVIHAAPLIRFFKRIRVSFSFSANHAVPVVLWRPSSPVSRPLLENERQSEQKRLRVLLQNSRCRRSNNLEVKRGFLLITSIKETICLTDFLFIHLNAIQDYFFVLIILFVQCLKYNTFFLSVKVENKV